MKKNMISMKALKAFTLLEMIVVIAIIIVLSSIMVPNIMGRRRIARIQAANDGAYQIYVAAQNYLNSLQKTGKDASDYFGKVNYNGHKSSLMDSGIGFLVCDCGVLKGVKDTDALKTEAYTWLCDGDGIKPTKADEAFNGICDYQMGKVVTNYGDADYPADSDIGPICNSMFAAGESFLIEVFVNTYTVRVVYYTDYKTYYGDGATKVMYKDEIFRRIYKAHDDMVDDVNASHKTMAARGFSSMYESGKSCELSQEHVTKMANQANHTNGYAPAYMGQYPIPAYKVS